MFAILAMTSLLVAQRAMVKQCAHEEEVRPWQKVREATSCAHCPCLHQVCQIVGMSGYTPPARGEQKTAMLLSVAGCILAPDEFHWLAPNLAFSISSANVVALEIGGSEDGVTCKPKCQKCKGLCPGQISWISRKILDLQCIQTWQKRRVAPSQHEAEVIVANVDRPRVPVFVVEEVDNVNQMKHRHNDHRPRYLSELLILICSPGEVTSQVSKMLCLRGLNTHINVHATIPGRPLWKNLKSQYLPNLGFSSTPAQKSKIQEPTQGELDCCG